MKLPILYKIYKQRAYFFDDDAEFQKYILYIINDLKNENNIKLNLKGEKLKDLKGLSERVRDKRDGDDLCNYSGDACIILTDKETETIEYFLFFEDANDAYEIYNKINNA